MPISPKSKWHKNTNVILTMTGFVLTKFGFAININEFVFNTTRFVQKIIKIVLSIIIFSKNTTKYKYYANVYIDEGFNGMAFMTGLPVSCFFIKDI